MYERGNEVFDIIQEIYESGYKFLGVDINKSTWDFTVEYDSIRVGLSAVMGIGHAASEFIDTIKPISGIEDFLERVDRSICSKRAIIPLCLLGSFKELGEDSMYSYNKFYEIDKANLEEEFYLQSTKKKMSIYEDDKDIEEAFMKYAYTSGVNNELIPVGIDNFRNGQSFDVECILTRIKKIKDKTGKNMAFITVLTGDGSIEVTVFRDQYESYKKHLKKDKRLSIKVKKQKGFILNKVN